MQIIHSFIVLKFRLNLTLNFDIKYNTFLLYLIFHSLDYVVFKLQKSFKKFNICIINKHFLNIYMYILFMLFVILIIYIYILHIH